MQLQLLFDPLQWMFGRRDIHGAVRADQHQFGRRPPSRECRNKIHRGGIYPLQVLQNQQQRCRCRDDLQCLSDFAEHALASRAQQLAMQCFPLLACH